MKRFLSCLCAIAMALTAFSGVVLAETADALYGLTVNSHADPNGVELPISFGWKLKSDRLGAEQTAYKLELSADPEFEELLWTKSEESGLSHAIPFDGTLESGTDYWWRVTVTTDAGETLTASAHFLTGLLNEADYNGAEFVTGGTPVADADLFYTVDTDVYGGTGAASLVFNAIDAKNHYMWQLNFSDSATVQLKPHTCVAGSYKALSAYTVNVTEAVGGIEGLRKGAHLQVAVTAEKVVTYLNGAKVSEIPASALVGLAPFMGLVRYRGAGDEFSYYDNLVVKRGEELLLSYDFTAYNPFAVGALQDGKFLMSSTAGVALPHHADVFRTTFAPAKAVADAKLFMASLGNYDAWLNGQRIGAQELKPGYSNPNNRRYYNTFDVTDLIAAGDNALSAVVTGGWWRGGVVSGAGNSAKPLGFWAVLKITYADGTTEKVVTDPENWKTMGYAPVLMGDIFEGETYDARINTDWMQADYNDAGWLRTAVHPHFSGAVSTSLGVEVYARKDLERTVQSGYIYDGVTNQTADQYGVVKKTAELGDEAFTLKPGQTAILDFGQNFVGWEELTVSGKAGTQIRMRHAEMLNESKGLRSRGNDGPEGSLYLIALRGADATARYTLSGAETETYHSTHSFYGFRYLEITATEEVTVHQVRGQVLTSALEDTGSLVTADADVNQLLSNIHWGLYGNYLSVPTDCPQRNERNGWTADTQVFSVAAGYLNHSKEFLRTYLQSMRDTQRADGAYASVSPMGSFGNNFGALGWADAGIIVTYELYKQYGDVEILREMYDSMQRYLDGYLASTEKKGGAHNYGDWLAYESNDTQIKNMLAVSYYAYDALLMSKMAAALGKTEDAARYLEIYETEKEYFIEQFVQEDGTLKRSEQSVCLYALYLDLLPDETSFAAVKKQLTDNIRAKGNKLQTGFLGTKIILETLTEIGETELAYKLLLQHENPSWLYTVDQGATTMWERWNSFSVENGFGDSSMNSFNHYAYGAVAGWMYRYMAGIVPAEGYKTFTLQPHPDRLLGSAEAAYESVYGLIKSAWRYEGDTFCYTCTVPANTTATVMVPFADITALQGGDAQGLTFVEQKDGYAVYTAVAGSYRFTVQSPAGESAFNIAVNNADESVPAYLEYNGEKVKLSAAVEAAEGSEVTLTAKAYNDVDYQMVWYRDGENLGEETVTVAPAADLKLTVVPVSVARKNLALGATVTANSTVNSNWGAANLTDGVLIHNSSTASGWSSGSDGKNITTLVTPKTLVVDLGSKKTFDQWKIYPRTHGMADPMAIYCFPVAYTVEVSDDNSTWTTVATVTNGAVPESIYQPAVGTIAEAKSGRYLRFTFTAINSCDDYQNSHVQLSELAVCYASSEEVSTNLALGAGLTVSSNNGGTWDKKYLNDGASVGTATACGWSTQKLGVGTSATAPATLPTAVTVTLDLGTSTPFNQWKMYPRNHDLTVARMFPIDYTVAVSDDNANWKTVATVTNGPVPEVTGAAVMELETPATGRYVKFTVTKINLPDTWKNNLHVQLAELELYYDTSVTALSDYKDLFARLEPSHFEGGEQIALWLEKAADAETLIAEAEALLATLKLKDQAPMGAKYLHYCDYFETASEWLVEDAADLAALEQYSKTHTLAGFIFTQTADLSMEGVEGYTGIGAVDSPFAGTYDGGHYKITDLAINFNGNYVNGNGVGLFGNVSAATLRNVTLLDSSVNVLLPVETVNGDDYGVGGLVGRAVSGTLIENCHNGADVTLTVSDGSKKDLSVAGIAGRATLAAKIYNCVNSGNITSANHVAGITDWGQNSTNMAYIINCVNLGQLSGANRYAIARYNDLASSYLYRYNRYSNNYWLAGTADSATNRDASLQTAEPFTDIRTLVDGSTFYSVGWKLEEGVLLPGSFAEGDLNASGVADTADVICLLQSLVGYDLSFYTVADLNADGRVSIYDAILLLTQISQ